MRGLLILLLVGSCLSFTTFSHEKHLCAGFAEENDMWIAEDSVHAKGITEEVFHAVLDRIEDVYAPIIQARGKELEVKRKWSNGTVNAYAIQRGDRYQIHMFGGLARHETITPLGFAAVACHEIGHHIGGAPTYSGGIDWASAEGQSDYFAMLKCMRIFMDGLTQEQEVLFEMVNIQVDPFAEAKCDAIYSDALLRDDCYQNAMAGQSLGNLLASLSKSAFPEFDTPDTNIVTQTSTYHPKAQCRLDTYFHGALCDLEAGVDNTDQASATQGMCNRAEGYSEGVRPFCWYKPE